MKIELSIELGNDAMQTPQDVAGALGRVSDKLHRRLDFQPDEGGVILDDFGNSVESWHFTA